MIIVRKKRFTSIFVLTVFVVCFIGIASASAQSGPEPDFKPVADEIIGSSGITWAPKMNYARLILTVSRPDGTVFQKTFDSGSTPYIGLAGIFGDTPHDGAYTYELRVIPFTERVLRGKLEAAVARQRGLQGHKALTQSGYFSVRGGMIVTPGATEPGNVLSTPQEGLSGTKDQVILDDLIVDGSICVGQDCVNGESFGFDTIRLKENNLRIRFVDTSSTSSFPSRDWQITVNDSANGGANKFSIDDIDGGRTPFTIEAGAPSHSLYVDDGGRVGFGTSTPVTDLHVKTGNTPTLRLEQDGSSGFTPQTWDVAGNEANFFIRDATNGSTLPFRIRPGAQTSSIDVEADDDINFINGKIYFKSDGKVGLGTDSPSYPVHLQTDSSTNAEIVAERDGGAQTYISGGLGKGFFGTFNDFPLRLVVNNAWRMGLLNDNSLEMASGASCTSGGVWTSVSSREAKENIKGLSTDEAFVTLTGLTPVKFNYKAEKEEEYVGFIAEDVPELVASKDRKRLTSMDVVAVLTKVVQEQQKSLKEQQEMALQQQKTISELNKRIAELEKNSQ